MRQTQICQKLDARLSWVILYYMVAVTFVAIYRTMRFKSSKRAAYAVAWRCQCTAPLAESSRAMGTDNLGTRAQSTKQDIWWTRASVCARALSPVNDVSNFAQLGMVLWRQKLAPVVCLLASTYPYTLRFCQLTRLCRRLPRSKERFQISKSF